MNLGEAKHVISGLPGVVAEFDARDSGAVSGQATRGPATVRFRVAEWASDEEFQPYHFRDGGVDSGVGCAGVALYLDRKNRSAAAVQLAVDLQDALFRKGAPDAYCEG